MSADAVLGLAGAGTVALSGVYYTADVVRGGSRPQRTSWGVWTLVGILGVASSSAGGAGPGVTPQWWTPSPAPPPSFSASSRATANRAGGVSISTWVSAPLPAWCSGSSGH